MAEQGSFRNLVERRVFRIVTPDITQEEAKANLAFVTRIELTEDAQFTGVVQIAHPAADVLGQMGGMLGSTLAYSFIERADEDRTRRVYVTSLFPDHPFPWHLHDSRWDPESRLHCRTLGVSTHSGIPLLHVSVEVFADGSDYEKLEQELAEAGYAVIGAKPYEVAKQLVDFYKAHAAEPDKSSP